MATRPTNRAQSQTEAHTATERDVWSDHWAEEADSISNDTATASSDQGGEAWEELAAQIPQHARASETGPVELEITGVIPQLKQGGLWRDSLVWKDSLAAKLRFAGEVAMAEPLERCHTEQSFAVCSGCRSTRTFWNRCDNFFCPACAPRLARERRESIEWWSKMLQQPKHVVLTARNSDTLTFQRVKEFKAAITKLRRSKVARGWQAGTWSLEVTNEGRGWHLHAHLLIEAKWIDKQALAIRWAQLLKQDMAIVCVKDCRGKTYLQEVCKYTMKGSEIASWPTDQIVTFINAFQGQRTFGVFGALYGKRSEWREWIAGQRDHGKTCDCGCSVWRIYDEQAWAARLLELEHEAATRPPPVASVPVTQLDFLAKTNFRPAGGAQLI